LFVNQFFSNFYFVNSFFFFLSTKILTFFVLFFFCISSFYFMFLLLSYLLAPGAAVSKPAAPKALAKPLPSGPPGAPGGKLPPRTLYFFY